MIENSLSQSIYSGNGMGQHYTDPEHLVVRRSVELVSETHPSSIIDIACGRGITALTLAREANAPHIHAFDINEAGVTEMNALAEKEHLPIQGIVFNAASKEGYGVSADVIIAKDVFPFLTPEEGVQMFRNIEESLNPQGWLLMTAPSTRSRLYQESGATDNPLYRSLNKEAMAYIQTDLDHFSFTTIPDLAKRFTDYGIEMVEATHYGRAKGWIMSVGQKTV